MPRSSVIPLCIAAALGSACGSDNQGVVVDRTPTVLPPDGASLAFTSNAWAPEAGAGREVYALALDGSAPTRLTFCNQSPEPCDTIEAAFSPERTRAALLRRLGSDQPPAILYVDFTRGAGAELVPKERTPSGVEWSPAFEVLAYSAVPEGGTAEDLFRSDVARPTSDNQQNEANLSCPAQSANPCDPAIADRRPRISPDGTSAVYERIPPGGKGGIFIFPSNDVNPPALVEPGPGSEPLAGTPYVVGGNADPAYSPDGGSVVFRRLTSTKAPPYGTWDILVVGMDTGEVRTIVSGALYRGAPDWGAQGIAFPEMDLATGSFSLVIVQPNGSGRQVPSTLPSGYLLSHPRWFR